MNCIFKCTPHIQPGSLAKCTRKRSAFKLLDLCLSLVWIESTNFQICTKTRDFQGAKNVFFLFVRHLFFNHFWAFILFLIRFSLCRRLCIGHLQQRWYKNNIQHKHYIRLSFCVSCLIMSSLDPEAAFPLSINSCKFLINEKKIIKLYCNL
jgi:hypothetical protein